MQSEIDQKRIISSNFLFWFLIMFYMTCRENEDEDSEEEEEESEDELEEEDSKFCNNQSFR